MKGASSTTIKRVDQGAERIWAEMTESLRFTRLWSQAALSRKKSSLRP